MFKFKQIDRVYGVTADGKSINLSGGQIVMMIDGKAVDLNKVDFVSVPIIKERVRGKRGAGTSNNGNIDREAPAKAKAK